jgi:hypothetical protein
MLDTGRTRDAVLAGSIVAAAFYSDPYYGVYCAVMGAFIVLWRFSRVHWPAAVPSSRRLALGLNLVVGALVALIVVRLCTGIRRLDAGPIHIGLATLYTPQLILLTALACRIWLSWRPTLRLNVDRAQLTTLVRLGLVSVGVCVLFMAPSLIGIALRIADGRMPDTNVYWRSSPRGVDVLSYLVPNPNHAWFGDVTRSWFIPNEPGASTELVGSISVVALVVVASAAYLRLLPRMWVAFTAFFVALSLGPFIHIAGMNTSIIGPWALLRYVPVIGMARSPSRFAIVAVLGVSLLVGFSLAELSRRYRVPRPAWLLFALMLGIELIPAPRPLFSAAIPDVYRRVAVNGDETGRLLELPTGIRDGTSSMGNFNASSEYFQTAHQRPLVGGYLSRISTWRKHENQRTPMLRALFALSEGRPVSAEELDAARRSREAFLRRSCVKFVLINKVRASPELQEFAVDLLGLTPFYQDEGYALFTPADPPVCDPPTNNRRRPRITWRPPTAAPTYD